MKWLANLSVALFAATSLASPVPQSEEKRGYEPAIYRLKINAPSVSQLHGKYLSLKNNTVGVFNGGWAKDGLEFYTTEGARPGHYEFHTWPVGIIDHALALVGPNGLLNFQDLALPSRSKPAEGSDVLWREFTLGAVDPTSGAQIPAVSCQSATTSQWVAFPRGGKDWHVKWYDGRAFTTADYQRIGLVYESADTMHILPIDPILS